MDGELKRAFNAACKLLAACDRSEFEIRAALEKKRFSADVAEKTVSMLREMRLVDDEKFALRYAEHLVRGKKAGPRYIAQALARKGISEGASEAAAKKAFDEPDSQEKMIAYWVERKSSEKRKRTDLVKKKKRIFDFLTRRGFSPSLVLRQIGKIRD